MPCQHVPNSSSFFSLILSIYSRTLSSWIITFCEKKTQLLPNFFKWQDEFRKKTTSCLVISSHFVSDIISSQNPISPLSANVNICLTSPPPFVSQCFHLSYPPPPFVSLWLSAPFPHMPLQRLIAQAARDNTTILKTDWVSQY